MYEGERNLGWMIWPRFLDENGEVLLDGSVVPREAEALMCILDDELRKSVHQKRIEVGMPFVVCEGPRMVGKGFILAITGLFDP